MWTCQGNSHLLWRCGTAAKTSVPRTLFILNCDFDDLLLKNDCAGPLFMLLFVLFTISRGLLNVFLYENCRMTRGASKQGSCHIFAGKSLHKKLTKTHCPNSSHICFRFTTADETVCVCVSDAHVHSITPFETFGETESAYYVWGWWQGRAPDSRKRG